jgi:hypothetical protein
MIPKATKQVRSKRPKVRFSIMTRREVRALSAPMSRSEQTMAASMEKVTARD